MRDATTIRAGLRTAGRAAAVVSLALVGLAACGSDDDSSDGDDPERTTAAPTSTEDTGSTTTTKPDPVATTEVEIVDYSFEPQVITVSPGETVTWTNMDDFAHTTTGNGIGPDDPPLWDSGEMDPATEFSNPFPDPGTYTYFCNIHNQMTAEVIVE